MPKSHTLDPADIATENAVQQWLERCSYHLCDEDAQSRLAALANRVQGELSDKGIFVHSPIPEKIGAVDSAAWTAFEADLKRGYLQRTPEMEVLLKTLDEVHPIGKERLRTTTLTSLRQAMEGDPANPREITEAQLTKKFDTILNRLLNFALADTIPTPASPDGIGYIKLPEPKDLTRDTRHSLKKKLDIRRANPRRLATYLRPIIAARLTESFQPESTRMLRKDGKFRTHNGDPLRTISLNQFPDQVEWDLSEIQETLVAIEVMPLHDTEDLRREGRELAALRFEHMKKGKIPTLLLAYAAKFLDLPLSDTTLLQACGVTHSGSARKTFGRDREDLLHGLKSKHPQSWQIVAMSFLEEMRKLVLEWVKENNPFPLPGTGSNALPPPRKTPAPGTPQLTP